MYAIGPRGDAKPKIPGFQTTVVVTAQSRWGAFVVLG